MLINPAARSGFKKHYFSSEIPNRIRVYKKEAAQTAASFLAFSFLLKIHTRLHFSLHICKRNIQPADDRLYLQVFICKGCASC